MRHLIQFSTGIASAEVAWRVVAEHGAGNVVLLTADTRVEDPDNWRFAREVVARLGCEWIVLADGRTPMEVGRDEGIVPSNRMAVCSRILKRELMDAWRVEHYTPETCIVYLGFDWTEAHRFTAAERLFAPWTAKAPLMDPPYLWKQQILDGWRERGIEPPRLYGYGLAHSNCGGFCVRGGQAQWSRMLQIDRDGYLEWERQEEGIRAKVGPAGSILRDRTGGITKPLSLRSFRERIERQPGLFDEDDWGACGCFMDGSPAGQEAS